MRALVAPSHATHVSTFTSFARATSKGGWLTGFLVIGLWLAGGAAAVRGQSALDGFNPNANGYVNAIAVQADGKVLVGGDFTTLSPYFA